MAINENKVTWAPSYEVDPRTGDPNRSPIDDEIREYGIKYQQPLTLQIFNQLFKDYGDQIKELQNQITSLTQSDTDNQALLELMFQVGDIWITQTEDNPATRFGFGTWEKIQGKFSVASDSGDTDFDVAGKTGGTKQHTHGNNLSVDGHTLTLSQIPTITHAHEYTDRYYVEASNKLTTASSKETAPANYNDKLGSNGTDSDNDTFLTIQDTTEEVTFGGDESHSHGLSGGVSSATTLPPYEVYHYWRRTA